MWEILCGKGFAGGYTTVKDAVRELRKRAPREVYMPLSQPPGEAQVDFGYALARIGGSLRKIALFVMTLVHSDAMFVMAFPRECTEAFLEAHVAAFGFFGFVPARISYDNTKVAVTKIIGARERKLTAAFARLEGHYLFEPHFCRVRRAHEKLDCDEGWKCCNKAQFNGAYPVTVELKAIQLKSMWGKPICELSGSVSGTATVRGEVGTCFKQ